jgi:hypothetical protein
MGSPTGGYNAVLTRISTNQYILSYEDANGIVDKLSPVSLETLLAEMSKKTTKFNQNSINAVRAQAALIPAAALTSRALDDIKTILTSFYTNPNRSTYNEMVGKYNFYVVGRQRYVALSFENVLRTLSIELYRKVVA